jgi:hypothetical protein
MKLNKIKFFSIICIFIILLVPCCQSLSINKKLKEINNSSTYDKIYNKIKDIKNIDNTGSFNSILKLLLKLKFIRVNLALVITLVLIDSIILSSTSFSPTGIFLCLLIDIPIALIFSIRSLLIINALNSLEN